MNEFTLSHSELTIQDDTLLMNKTPYNGLIKEHYECGAKKCITQYTEGKTHGIYKEWYPNGKLSKACLFKDGMRHGECKQWWLNGQVKSSCSYNEGKLHGIFETFTEEGLRDNVNHYMMGREFRSYSSSATQAMQDEKFISTS